MQRREFLKNSLITATGVLVLPALSSAGVNDEPFNAAGFMRPPARYRPQVFWMWQNGHVSEEGITKDLEAMRQMGLGGAMLFNVEAATPKGPVDMGSAAWRQMVLFTMQEAQRLKLQITLHNSSGFSGTGGPFVQPDQSMQQLVWRTVQAVPSINTYHLPQPFSKLGYYRDIAVLAFPELPEPDTRQLWLNGEAADVSLIADVHPETALRLEKTGELVFEFTAISTIQSVTIWRKPEVPADVYNGPPDNPPTLTIESSADGVNYAPVCKMPMPQLRKMNAPGAAVFPAVHAKFLRLKTSTATWLSGIRWHAHAGVNNWPGKANFYQYVPATSAEPPATEGIRERNVLDLTHLLQPDGTLSWSPPTGRWTILRIGHTATGQLGASQPAAGAGLVLDKFSRKALDNWWQHMDDYIFKDLRSCPAFGGLLIDSWEVGVQNWTLEMPEAFRSRNNYSIISWLPALTGRIVEDADATNRFLADFRRTQATLVAKEYYGGFKAHCREYGWHLWGEPYGDGMFDSFEVTQQLDMPIGEFWTRYAPGSMNCISTSLSAGHTAGKQVIGAEAFTGLPETSRWTDYPYNLKVQGDHFYSIGINQMVLSMMVHQPYRYGAPGFSMAHFGAHFDRTNPWMPFASGWTDYLTRTQYLMQQGHYAADFVFFKGEEPSATVPDIDLASPSAPTGYGADVMGPDALFSDISIRQHEIVFPDGMRYKVMALIQQQSMSVRVLQKLKALVEKGMWLAVNEAPASLPGLDGNKAEQEALVNAIWGDLDGVKVKEHRLGAGTVFRGKLLAEIIQLPPDFTYTAPRRDAAIRFTHRRTGTADIYFVSNRLRRYERVTAEFRVKGMQPELWNAETGSITDVLMYEATEHGIRIPLEFSPGGAWLVVFRKPLAGKGIRSLLQDGNILAATHPYVVPEATQWRRVRQTFSIEVWIKPDSYAMPGKGYVVFPAEGEVVYGKGITTAGIAAGQNVIRICERAKGAAYFSKDVVAVYAPVSGWTHVVAVYHNGAPALYINGKLAGQAPAGDHIVIPGLGTKPTGELQSGVFEGNATASKLYREALSPQKILAQYSAGLPAPELPGGMVIYGQGARRKALVRENGDYWIDGLQQKVTDKCSVHTVKGPWQLSFEAGRGAPAGITLPELISLRNHPDFNVRHFAGVVSYDKTIHISAAMLQKGKRVFLDLGRVEVVAAVNINGKDAGLCWKEPYQIDITPFVHTGENKLRIQVATLWPNRQIGDEYLPAENNYSSSNYITALPDWLVQNKENPGRRISFSSWNNYKKDDPLLEAGLLGPVRLQIAWEASL